MLPYTTAMDVWSVGCIIAELCLVLSNARCPAAERKRLFERQGNAPDGFPSVATLRSIARILGSKTLSSSLGWLSRYPCARSSVKSLLSELSSAKACAHSRIEHYMPGTPVEAVALVKSLLCFDPAARSTVDEAMAHPFFDPVTFKIKPGGAWYIPEPLPTRSLYDSEFDGEGGGDIGIASDHGMRESPGIFLSEAELTAANEDEMRVAVADEIRRCALAPSTPAIGPILAHAAVSPPQPASKRRCADALMSGGEIDGDVSPVETYHRRVSPTCRSSPQRDQFCDSPRHTRMSPWRDSTHGLHQHRSLTPEHLMPCDKAMAEAHQHNHVLAVENGYDPRQASGDSYSSTRNGSSDTVTVRGGTRIGTDANSANLQRKHSSYGFGLTDSSSHIGDYDVNEALYSPSHVSKGHHTFGVPPDCDVGVETVEEAQERVDALTSSEASGVYHAGWLGWFPAASQSTTT